MVKSRRMTIILLVTVFSAGARVALPSSHPTSASTVPTDGSVEALRHYKADPTTARGAIIALAKAFGDDDAKLMAKYYIADNDPDQKFALANARRILGCVHFAEAVDQKFHENGEVLTKGFGLFSDKDAVWLIIGEVKEQGDTATADTDGGLPPVHLRKIGGIWKVDITPAAPETAENLASAMMDDAKKLNELTAEIRDDKFATMGGVRDALLRAKLHATPDAKFKASNYRIQSQE